MNEPEGLADLLRDMAGQAPSQESIPVDRLRRRIRSQRKMRAAAATGGVALAVGTTAVGVALASTQLPSGDSGTVAAPSGTTSAGQQHLEPETQRPSLSCGDPVPADAEAGDGSLIFQESFPDRASLADGPSIEGTIEVRNQSGRRITGITGSLVDMVLVEDGVIVATPLPKTADTRSVDIPHGSQQSFDAGVSLETCATLPGGQTTLEPGTYQLYSFWDLIPRDEWTPDDGPGGDDRIEVVPAGPWQIELQQ